MIKRAPRDLIWPSAPLDDEIQHTLETLRQPRKPSAHTSNAHAGLPPEVRGHALARKVGAVFIRDSGRNSFEACQQGPEERLNKPCTCQDSGVMEHVLSA